MSEGDVPSSPAKEEMDVSENGDADKTKEESDKEDNKEEQVPKEEEDGDEEEADEEPPLGLLERPVVLTSGKREKKKVERLAMSISLPNADRKKVDIQEGAGTKLGDCPRVEFKLNQIKAIDLKPLHRLLFNRAGANPEVKKNIRQFSGFAFAKDDKEYEKRMTSLNKMTIPGLKQICEVLDIERSGTKAAIIERMMDFLMKPSSSGLKVPQKKKRKSKGGDGDKKGAKRKRTSKKKETKSKANKTTVSDISDSDEEEEEDEEEKKSESEEEDDEPPKKKPKVQKKSPVKKEAPKAKKQNGKQEKAAKQEKKETKKKTVSDSDDSDSDDEPLIMKKEEPPSNSELKDVIKKILDGANLEEVTMKTVVRQVYEKYQNFDLTDRKEFIKTTVREIIS